MLKELFKNSAVRTIAFLVVLTIIFIVLTYNWFIEFSSFSVGMAKGVLGFLIVWIFDKYAMKEIDTVEELKKENVAYALFFLGLCIVIAAAIVNS